MARDVLPVRADGAERARWRAAAAIDGVTLSEWMRRACDAACVRQAERKVMAGLRGMEPTAGVDVTVVSSTVPVEVVVPRVTVEGQRAVALERRRARLRAVPGPRMAVCVHRVPPDEPCAACDPCASPQPPEAG